MKKIITAMGNNKLAIELKKTELFNVITKDISYKEGILEILEENNQIDIIIINEILDGEIDFKDLIKKILQINEKIEIIVFVEEKNPEIQNFLFMQGIYRIYENNEIDISTFIKKLSKTNVNENDVYQIGNLNATLMKIREDIYNNIDWDKFNFEADGKIYVVLGTYNCGKSLLSSALAKDYAKQGNKTLIIDFDIYNKSISTIFDIKNQDFKEIANVEKQIINISKNLDILCVMDLIFCDNNTVEYVDLNKLINSLKVKYDIIIIDTSSNYNYKYLKQILNFADKYLFIVVPSGIEIKKEKSLIEVLLEDFKIDKEKMEIILNKVNAGSIDKDLIKKIFSDIKISGITKYDEWIEQKVANKKLYGKTKIIERIGN